MNYFAFWRLKRWTILIKFRRRFSRIFFYYSESLTKKTQEQNPFFWKPKWCPYPSNTSVCLPSVSFRILDLIWEGRKNWWTEGWNVVKSPHKLDSTNSCRETCTDAVKTLRDLSSPPNPPNEEKKRGRKVKRGERRQF